MGPVAEDPAAVRRHPLIFVLSLFVAFLCIPKNLISRPDFLSPPSSPRTSLPDTSIWMLFFDDVAPHTLRRLAEEAGVRASAVAVVWPV